MKVLVKLPTRSRPQKALKVIREYSQKAHGKLSFLVSYDMDDHTMNSDAVHAEMMAAAGDNEIIICGGSSASKIHAINRDMHKAPEFDILVLASDDMECQVEGWDKTLIKEMTDHFPDTDGVLFHWDGDPATFKHNEGFIPGINGKGGLNTMCILGRKYFERFGYIYHPSYVSLWCDNEFTDVADMLEKQFRSEMVLFKHVHHSNTPGMKPDAHMIHTQSFYNRDAENYRKRKSINFGL